MEEVWLPVGNPDYLVSSLGRVKRIEKCVFGKSGCFRTKKEKLLLQTKNKDGYLLVTLFKGYSRKPYLVHRLVAECFLDNPMRKMEVNHKDGVKTNNSVSNLEWCTNQENIRHAISLGRHIAKINLDIAEEIRELWRSGVPAYRISKMYNIGNTTVFNIVHDKTWKRVG